jgi:hypothetical protein
LAAVSGSRQSGRRLGCRASTTKLSYPSSAGRRIVVECQNLRSGAKRRRSVAASPGSFPPGAPISAALVDLTFEFDEMAADAAEREGRREQ